MVPRKGGDAYAITCLLREIEKVMGYKRIILKSDQEPAILDLKNKVKRLTKVDIMMEETPIGDSQAGGMFENAVKQTQAMARTYKLALEKRLGADIHEDHPIIPWLIRHGVANRNRFHLGKDGMTAQRRLKGEEFPQGYTRARGKRVVLETEQCGEK